MGTSSRTRRRPAKTFEEQALNLAWGAWAELGVSGWVSSHGDWAIDPEPLILFTSFLGDRDPRLRDEATDWCVRNWRHVSKARLKNLARLQSDDDQASFGEFAATVGEHAGIDWPGATTARPFTVTGRSTLPPLERPSLVWLRLRAMFGLGARTEILRFFLSSADRRASVATITRASGYLKRTISDECELLERAGVLSSRTVGNRFSFKLAKAPQLEAFVGDIPDVRPDWTAMFNVASELVRVEERMSTATLRTAGVKARSALRHIEDDLADLDLDDRSADLTGADVWPALQSLGNDTLGAWSIGRWETPPVSS